MRQIVVLAEASKEAQDAARHYEDQADGLGHQFVQALAEAVERIRAHPDLYPLVEANLRKCRVKRFPYGIVYRVDAGRIVIMAVMHLKRGPDSLHSRR